jgi:hypothetical protein
MPALAHRQKKVSQKGDEPLINSIGLVVTRLALHIKQQETDTRMFRALRSQVRTRQNIQSALSA